MEQIAVAFKSGRDGFWLARWLRAQGIEAYVIHGTSTAVCGSIGGRRRTASISSCCSAVFWGGCAEKLVIARWCIPSREEEDGKRPGRERETLVSQCTRIVNGMKSDLARLGVRNFNPKLKKAQEKLDAVRTPEETRIPPNTIAKLKRDMERFRLLKEQIQKIEVERFEQINWRQKESACQ